MATAGERNAERWKKVEVFKHRIVEWYRLHGDRDLPWRRTSDPWAVLVAAFLLRKTTARQVLKVYTKFMRMYSNPFTLLNTRISEVEELIKPLGIEHQRARHLIELARRLVEGFGGTVPCSKEELKKLPGVGDYIASEVLLVACGQPEPLLDRNMLRVLERVFGVRSSRPRPHMDPDLWKFARELIPQGFPEAREFSYGVLDFARKVCKARKPSCSGCPMADICYYFGEGFC